ncbi:MAG: hypothetical protein RL685_5160 [Pseudomonadota bacterium]
MSAETDPGHVAPVLELVRGAKALQTRLKDGVRCRHDQTEVDGEDRSVSCRSCGATLDAFDVLLQYARRERNWHYWDQETRELEAKVQALKEEERKVKARTKSASRKDAATAVAAERERTERERFEIITAARDVVELGRRIERLTQRRRTL